MSIPWTDIIVAFLISVVGAVIGRFLRVRIQTRHQEGELQKNKESIDFHADGVILAYGRAGKIYPFVLAGFFLSVPVLMLLARMVNSPQPLVEQQYETVTLAVMLFIFGVVPWLAFVHAFSVRHMVTTQGILRRSAWLKSMYATWDQIESVSHSYWLDAYVLRTCNGTIRVRSTLENVSYLEEMIAKKVPASSLDRTFSLRLPAKP